MQILKALLTGNKAKDFIAVSIINGKNASEYNHLHHLHQVVEMVNVNQEKAVVVVRKIVEVVHREAVEALALKTILELIHPILPKIKAPLSLGQ
jgi:hypothetical protein